jgi:hypothetical protein
MHRLKVEAGMTIFLLFFGTALIDSLRRHTWLLTAVYVGLAALFLFAGRRHQSVDDSSAPNGRKIEVKSV